MAKKNMTLEEKLEEAIVKDDPYEVPRNWFFTDLGNICRFHQGLQVPKDRQYDCAKENRTRFIRIVDYTQSTEDIRYIDMPTDYANYFVKLDDVVMVRYGTIGNVGRGIEGVIANNMFKIAPNNKIVSKEYLFLFLRSPEVYDFLIKSSSSSTMPAINFKVVSSIKICIPPLKEQQRIVDRIESLFEKLDKAKELIEEARDGFEKRKAAILEKAFRGELTNISNTDGIEEALVNNDIDFDIFNSRYKLSNLDRITEEKPRNGYSPKAVEYETSTKTLKLGAITRGYFNENEFKYIDEVIDKDSYLWLKNGDFLIQRANSLEYVGISAIYNMEDNIFIYPDLIMKFRVKKDIYNAKLLWYWINSRYGRWYFINKATGTAGNMPKINQKIVMNLPIPVIPFNEQQQIVKILDKLLEEESKIEELTQLEEQIDLIKKSILSKAFRGELGTNSSEDEKALELLKEILSKQ